MDRGIIACPAKVLFPRPGSTALKSLEPADLNYLLLYYDKVVIPQERQFNLTNDMMIELVQNNIIESPLIRYTPFETRMNPHEYFGKIQSIAANHILAIDKSNDWTLHDFGDAAFRSKSGYSVYNSIKLDFLNCLPVPTKDVRYEEVLKFKESRQSELKALHAILDDLYLEVLRSPDRDFARRRVLSDLNTALANLHTVANEKFKVSHKFSITTDLNVNYKNVLAGVASGISLDLLYGIPLLTGLGVVGSFMNIKLSHSVSADEAKTRMKVRYLISASRRGII